MVTALRPAGEGYGTKWLPTVVMMLMLPIVVPEPSSDGFCLSACIQEHDCGDMPRTVRHVCPSMAKQTACTTMR